MKEKTKFVLTSLLCGMLLVTAIGISNVGQAYSASDEDPSTGWSHKSECDTNCCENFCGTQCGETTEMQCEIFCNGGTGGGHCPA